MYDPKLDPALDDVPDPEELTPKQRRALSVNARRAAREEYAADLNRTDPKHTQDRMKAAVGDLRERMGLPRDG